MSETSYGAIAADEVPLGLELNSSCSPRCMPRDNFAIDEIEYGTSSIVLRLQGSRRLVLGPRSRISIRARRVSRHIRGRTPACTRSEFSKCRKSNQLTGASTPTLWVIFVKVRDSRSLAFVRMINPESTTARLAKATGITLRISFTPPEQAAKNVEEMK